MTPRLDHVSIATKDLDRSVAFYSGLLGLRLTEMSGESNVKVSFADIDLGRGQVLELLQAEGADAPVDHPSGHFALAVDDIEEVHRTLTQAGVVSKGSISEIDEPGHWHGARAVYVLDPDGVTVELIQHRTRSARDDG
jgi:catechol 2,3-dioxygenase-like lactoylglutathione lyase family enzyme